ncbi:hypothetical protein GpartN1_g707.t1 [Galdieria partita]|uniref:Lipid-binding serum glycoprotein N-terminal domain-containing protein n=1 Tax=Galdieria partita TaxID=83374 RepID=A0A9C7PR82_9RHOD|nr:hypothetical protein GpartN1_g313.t1 [Galdieria partita]GJQ08916.1 hypothetical protein GpartN1_g707.t1 [Galdieria partita]
MESIENPTESTAEALAVDEQQLVETIKQRILPQLRDKVVGMRFPDFETSGTNHSYSLQQMILSRVTFPPEKIKLHSDYEHGTYQLCCNDIQLYIDIGLWKYEAVNHWKVKDQGSAVASLTKVSLVLSFRFLVDADTGLLQMSLLTCKVTVGKAKLRFGDTSSRWLYNLIALLFHGQLKKIASKALEDYSKQVMEEQLQIWSHKIFGVV